MFKCTLLDFSDSSSYSCSFESPYQNQIQKINININFNSLHISLVVLSGFQTIKQQIYISARTHCMFSPCALAVNNQESKFVSALFVLNLKKLIIL